MRIGILILPLLLVLLLAPVLRAEKPDLAPAALREIATHVVQGQVTMIYTRTSREGGHRVTRYVAEVSVRDVEKGEGLTKGDLVYARYWQRAWVGPGMPPTGTSGHRGLPTEGEALRLYLARKAYDGFHDSEDGGYDVIGCNGFERLEIADAE